MRQLAFLDHQMALVIEVLDDVIVPLLVVL